MKRLINVCVFMLLSGAFLCLKAQEKKPVNPNGYNTFYYENGQKSSEGNMRDGKPDGYWKTYHANGNIKSEGNRKDFQLDSIWKFNNEMGILQTEINYKEGKKNGFKKTYDAKEYFLLMEEFYVNDVKQGVTNHYHRDGKLKTKINFENGKEEGVAYEYDTTNTIIGIVEYKYGFIKRQEKINRKDGQGLKQGMWKEFYPVTMVVKNECNYTDGLMNGFLKEYDARGNLTSAKKFEMGKEIVDVPELAKIDKRNAFHDNGVIKYSGGYKDSIPQGVHREYNDTGKVIASKVYLDGVLVSDGIVDEFGREQGSWTLYWATGQLRAKGEYKDGKRIGPWEFYHPNGKTEQLGKYDNKGKAQGNWKWFYDSGRTLREENYLNGTREGMMIEYSDSGTVITKGEYVDGQKEGAWFFEWDYYREEGSYKGDKQDGEWKAYYLNNKRLKFEGKFVDGVPDGYHLFYYDDGKLNEEGKYIMGNKEGDWKIYDENGMIFLIIKYKSGVELKFDGVKVQSDNQSEKQDLNK